jgi:hypothetical protein
MGGGVMSPCHMVRSLCVPSSQDKGSKKVGLGLGGECGGRRVVYSRPAKIESLAQAQGQGENGQGRWGKGWAGGDRGEWGYLVGGVGSGSQVGPRVGFGWLGS